MKHTILIITLIFFSHITAQAAIPIQAQEIEQQEIIYPTKKKEIRKAIKQFLKEPAKKDIGLFNMLSLICGVLGIGLTLLTGLGGIPFFIAAIVLGIIGLSRGEKYKGMGIAGIILGGLAVLLGLLAIGIIIALFGL
jgi:hypothetical protein